ncbi:WSD1 family O-acyltransferase [Rhizobium laguerreae]|uniref:WSD1 family O-acyltransferase n=1 Tax=Rhizobium laguerreae TaxID=1076926 RepID=UPI001C92AE03|nr:WSD1 family O-acyltransferase [Rhizobium laguerreae]MBY3151394.1 WSD1 family O-acyltransferase [Rhizobium laguerreae]
MDEDRFKQNLVKLLQGMILPMPVKPESVERVRAVRDILRRKYKLSRLEASFTAAALFGFLGPYYAIEVCLTSRYDDDLEAPDEQCEPVKVIKRRREQAATLVTLLEISAAEAKEVISRIRPTASNWKPSLRKPKWHGQQTVSVE